MLARILVLLLAALVPVLGACNRQPPPDAVADTEDLERADRWWCRGDTAGVRQLLEQVLETNSRSFAARYRLGELEVHDQPREAIRDLEQAAALAPDHPGPPVFTGLAKRQLHDYEGGRRDLAAGLALAQARAGFARRDTAETLARGIELLNREDYAPALETLAEAVAEDSTSAVPWYHYGEAALRSGLLPRAEQAARRAASANDSFPEARVLLAIVLTSQGMKDEAREELDAALAEQPDLASAHFRRGLQLLADSEYNAAALEFRTAVLEDPTVPEHHALLGRTLMEMQSRFLGSVALHHHEALNGFLDRHYRRGDWRQRAEPRSSGP